MFHFLWKAHYYSLFCQLIFLLLLQVSRSLCQIYGYSLYPIGCYCCLTFCYSKSLSYKKSSLRAHYNQVARMFLQERPWQLLKCVRRVDIKYYLQQQCYCRTNCNSYCCYGQTNVIIQVEIHIAPINQHGVHDTIKEFKSNINLQNNEKRDKHATCHPPSCQIKMQMMTIDSCFLDLVNLQRWRKIWSLVTHLQLQVTNKYLI